VTIIEGVQICTTNSERADAVIKAMEDLLDARKHCRITRRMFLKAWRKLRLRLFLTRDYQQLRATVFHETGGMCEKCTKRTGNHLHHLDPVVFAPRRALDRSNIQLVCVECHGEADVESRTEALARR